MIYIRVCFVYQTFKLDSEFIDNDDIVEYNYNLYCYNDLNLKNNLLESFVLLNQSYYISLNYGL